MYKRVISLIIVFLAVCLLIPSVALADESEPNDSFASADQFIAGDEQFGALTTTSDTDYYKVCFL